MKHKKFGNALEERMKKVIFVFMVIVIAYSAFLLVKSGLVRGASAEIDKKREKLILNAKIHDSQEGLFVDRNDKPITLQNGVGKVSTVSSVSYSYIIGYSSKVYASSGLRKRYEDDLYDGYKDETGATIKLTTDSAIQDKAYSLLKHRGSLCVLDNETGAILAMASRDNETLEYDVNKIEENWDAYSEGEVFYDRNLIAATPGSTFKAITAAAALEKGLGDYSFEDQGEYLNIHNSKNKAYGKIGMEKALIKSVNTYYASLGVKVGKSAIEKTMKAFKLGETIDCDFGSLTSVRDLKDGEESYLAQVSFGQGETEISPLFMASIYASIVNGGKLMEPYLVERIENDGRVRKEHEAKILSNPISEETSETLKGHLKAVACDYGLTKKACGVDVYAKTGTADLSSEEGNNKIWLVAATDKYTIVMSYDQTDLGSHSLIEPVKNLIKFIEKI